MAYLLSSTRAGNIAVFSSSMEAKWYLEDTYPSHYVDAIVMECNKPFELDGTQFLITELPYNPKG